MTVSSGLAVRAILADDGRCGLVEVAGRHVGVCGLPHGHSGDHWYLLGPVTGSP
jgi:hypothetical protein